MPDLPYSPEGSGNYVITNALEDVVKETVLSMIEYMNMCSCEKCVSDACAMVLNQFLPNYVTTRKGELLSQIPQSMREQRVDLTVKVVHALQLVKESPRH